MAMQSTQARYALLAVQAEPAGMASPGRRATGGVLWGEYGMVAGD